MGTPLLQQISLRNTGLPLRTQEFHDKSGYYTHATLKSPETPQPKSTMPMGMKVYPKSTV